MEQWDRQYRLSAGQPGSTGFMIGSESSGRSLHISFSLEKSDTQSSNTGTITISNLNDTHKAQLSEEDCYIELAAGYSSNLGNIFSGWVDSTEEDLSGGDRDMKIEVIDGFLNTDLQGSISLSGTVTCQAVVDACVEKLEVTSSVITEAAAEKLALAMYDNGFAFVGKYRAALQNVCRKAGVTFSIQNGILQIYVSGEAVTESAYILSSKTGLISIPKKITISESNSNSGTSSDDDSDGTAETGIPGYEVEYFLNPAIGVNDLVQVDSSQITGFYRVHKLTITGDNYTGDWKCTAQLIEIDG